MRGLTREFYIPKNARQIDNEEAVVYLYEVGEKPCAVGFVGKRSKPEFHNSYRNEEAREKATSAFLENWQRIMREKREAQQRRKAEGTQLTEAAQVAAAIRRVLALAFPGVKFRVTSENFSMGNAVDIHWTDGPTSASVDALVSVYQYGHFDGMTDCYEYSNRHKDMPQAKYVHATRHMSDETRARMIAQRGNFDAGNWQAEEGLRRDFRELDLTPR